MPIGEKLLLLPPWITLCIIIFAFVSLSLMTLYIIRKKFHYSILENHNDVGGFIFATLGVIYGVLLAFVVVMVWEQYNNAEDIAAHEASQAMAMYRDMNVYPNQEQISPLRQNFLGYIELIVHDEYPSMALNKQSESTDKAADKMWEEIKFITPKNLHEQSVYNELMTDINKLEQYRFERNEIARNASLPPILWNVLLLGAIATLFYSTLFGTKHSVPHAIMVSLLATIIAATLFIILEMDRPFMGEISAKAEGFHHLLEAARQK